MSGTELAFRIVCAVVALVCVAVFLLIEVLDVDAGCLALVVLFVLGSAAAAGAFGGPAAAADWLGVNAEVHS